MIRADIQWINNLIKNDLPETEIIEHLEAAGIEVEGLERSGNFDDNFLVGEITEIEDHPNADKLKLAIVDIGEETKKIVCGASNIKVGDKVPVALPGAKLPDGSEITKAKIRGEASQGMLCSAKELNLGHDHSGIFKLEPHLEPGVLLDEVIEETTIIELSTAANRPDLQSIIGLSREVAAHANSEVKEFDSREVDSNTDDLFNISDKENVTSYNLARIRINGDALQESPDWIQKNLLSAGLQPRGLIIDLTNFVMLETGQPLHAFEASKITLPIDVRKAKKKEKIVLIDESEIDLTTEDLIISDNNNAIALAGVMGGKDTEVSSRTKEILLESATFDSSSVRLSALRHHKRTEASSRFERGLHPNLTNIGINYFIKLLNDVLEVDLVEQQSYRSLSKIQQNNTITLKTSDFENVIGYEIPDKSMFELLQRFSRKVERKEGTFVVHPHWWRSDLKIKEDIIEEIMKLRGLEEVSAKLPDAKFSVTDERNINKFDFEKRLRSLLLGAGVDEVVTYSFIGDKEKDIILGDAEELPQLLNPRSVEQKYLRNSLSPSLVVATSNNRQNQEEFSFFEISNVFKEEKGHVSEINKLGVISHKDKGIEHCRGVLGLIETELGIDFEVEMTDTKGPFSESAEANIYLNGDAVGFIGKLDKEITLEHKIKEATSYLELELEPLRKSKRISVFSPLLKHQPASRDITLLLSKKTLWKDIENQLKTFEGLNFEFKDEYIDDEKYGLNKKTVTAHLELFSKEKTLDEDEIVKRMEEIKEVLQKELDADII